MRFMKLAASIAGICSDNFVEVIDLSLESSGITQSSLGGVPRPVPFLKWAGGKRWLVSEYSDVFPKSFGRYFEPFLGSAAVFFHLAPEQATLSDVNSELVNSYLMLKEDWFGVERLLEKHEELHCAEYYYQLRSRIPRSLVGRAARFLYLNRTCWNGLYRENKNGQFNVPKGTKDSVVLDDDDFASSSLALQSADIVCCDFEGVINQAVCGDLIFVDPPYTVKHNHNGFVKYNQKIFSWDDQVRLRDSLVRARRRGAFIVVTNAAHSSIQDLYVGFDQKLVSRRSGIAGDSSTRGMTDELIITAL
jgi:DNA adenine methylase